MDVRTLECLQRKVIIVFLALRSRYPRIVVVSLTVDVLVVISLIWYLVSIRI